MIWSRLWADRECEQQQERAGQPQIAPTQIQIDSTTHEVTKNSQNMLWKAPPTVTSVLPKYRKKCTLKSTFLLLKVILGPEQDRDSTHAADRDRSNKPWSHQLSAQGHSTALIQTDQEVDGSLLWIIAKPYIWETLAWLSWSVIQSNCNAENLYFKALATIGWKTLYHKVLQSTLVLCLTRLLTPSLVVVV